MDIIKLLDFLEDERLKIHSWLMTHKTFNAEQVANGKPDQTNNIKLHYIDGKLDLISDIHKFIKKDLK